MEFNKIFAAILCAGILGMVSGIAAEMLVEPEHLAQPAYPIEGVEVVAGGAGAAGGGAAALEPVEPLLASANVANGEKIAGQCKSCHTFEKGGPNRVGPNLWGVVGNHHAHAEGFAYSAAMSGLKDKTWDFAALNEFIYKPAAAVPGTKMGFAGLKKTQDRADLLAWLDAQSDKPLPLPAAGPTPVKAAAPGAPAPADAGAQSNPTQDAAKNAGPAATSADKPKNEVRQVTPGGNTGSVKAGPEPSTQANPAGKPPAPANAPKEVGGTAGPTEAPGAAPGVAQPGGIRPSGNNMNPTGSTQGGKAPVAPPTNGAPAAPQTGQPQPQQQQR
jgi:cytochrome c